MLDGQGLANAAWAPAALYLHGVAAIDVTAIAPLRIAHEFESTQNLSNQA